MIHIEEYQNSQVPSFLEIGLEGAESRGDEPKAFESNLQVANFLWTPHYLHKSIVFNFEFTLHFPRIFYRSLAIMDTTRCICKSYPLQF